MKKLYKKSEAGLAIVIVIMAVLFFFGWLINFSQMECRSNKDCGSEAYCGSDYSCHTYPTIQKTVVQYNFLWPSIIIGIAIVIAAIIFRWDKISAKKETIQVYEESNQKIPQEVEDISEPYYKANGDVKTP